MQHLSNGFNTLKVNEWFNSCIDVDSSNNVKIFIKPFKYNCKVAYVLVYYNKCKMQPMNNGFNILKLNDLTRVPPT